MKDALTKPRRDSLPSARLGTLILGLRKPLLLTGALFMSLGFSASALPPAQNEPSANAEADWDVRRDLHACAHLTGQPARMCAAYAKARRNAEREVRSVPARAYWREEARLRRADMKYAATLRRCAYVVTGRQAVCRDAAKTEIVQLWNELSRAGVRADAERKAARIADVAHPTPRASSPFYGSQ